MHANTYTRIVEKLVWGSPQTTWESLVKGRLRWPFYNALCWCAQWLLLYILPSLLLILLKYIQSTRYPISEKGQEAN